MAGQGLDLAHVRKRADNVWSKRAPWDAMYQEAYDFAVPMRRPGGDGREGLPPERLFDMTAPMSAMFFAGNLQRDLFPSGQPTFTLETGPVAAMAINDAEGVKVFNRELEKIAKRIHPFFLSGDWDTAVHEMCIDLAVGTGAIIPLKGDIHSPVHFACIPFDQLAVGCDAWGRVVYVSWKQTFELEQLLGAFPKGKFPDSIKERAKANGTQETELRQDFFKDAGGAGWHFIAYVKDSLEPIVHERYRTQPIAVPRYYRVPGESYGRGVILTALPSIKTLNKAQELALKSAAINMLGIWGYRAGGTFNPDTVRIGPGEFWSMQSTGGILGPDVQRIDPASGRMDVAKMVIGNLQDQIRQAMFDTRLPEYQGTPRAASEIAARLRQKADVHIGAFGRLVREIMPVVVPRVAEILFEFGYLSQPAMRIDELLISIKVQSPMSAALNADRLASIANYLEFVGAIAGPESIPLYAHIERVLDRVGDGLQIDKELIPTGKEREEMQAAKAEAKNAQMMEMFAAEMAKQTPKMIASAAGQQVTA